MAGSFRDDKRAARRQLHEGLSVAAFYVDMDNIAAEYPLNVRLHTSFNPEGQVAGGDSFSAQVRDVQPRIVFLISELSSLPTGRLKRLDVVSVETGEAYSIKNIRTADDVTVIADVTRVKIEDTAGLPVP